MSKGVKKILGGIIILVLVLAIIWFAYEALKPETVSIGATNVLPNENMGIDNVTNDFLQNEVLNNVEENEVVNEVAEDAKNEVVEEPTDENNNDNDSELVSGDNMSREERAVELAKKYYEEEYGSTEGIYFRCDEVYKDGRYIVIASSNGATKAFLFVNLDTELVEEK